MSGYNIPLYRAGTVDAGPEHATGGTVRTNAQATHHSHAERVESLRRHAEGGAAE